MSKREQFYADVERMKEWYRRCPTDQLRVVVSTGNIPEYKAAARAVLAEREHDAEPADYFDLD